MKKIIVIFFGVLFSTSLFFGQSIENDKEKVILFKEKIDQTKEKIDHDKKELKSYKSQLSKIEDSDVSLKTIENFNSDFGDMENVIWKSENEYDVASFTNDGKIKKAYYNFDSKWIGTIWSVPFDEIPEKAQEKINDEYKDYEIGPVIFYDDNESIDIDMYMYDTEFKHEDSYFVELIKGSKKIAIKVNNSGDVSFFKKLK